MMHEGVAEVPGAALRYRLTGQAGTLPLLVLENGWGASYDYFALMEAELAPHAQLLLYNRAGVGGSIAREPQTPEGMSRQLAGLLDHLGVRDPVVVLGQSYGGLIGGVHAALIPQRLHAIVQVDPTPDVEHPSSDPGFALAVLTNILIGLATLRIPEPLLAAPMSELPPEALAALRRNAFSNAASLRGAKQEMALLQAIRAACAMPTDTTRLVITADRSDERRGPILKMLISRENQLKMEQAKIGLHQATAARGTGSVHVRLPHTHGGVVCTKVGARDTTRTVLEFLSGLDPANQGRDARAEVAR